VALVEATGAGDGFNSGVISGLLPYLKKSADKRKALRDLSLNQLADIIRRANAIGAIACTKAGAIPALPTKAETDIFLKSSAQASS
jgi:fructokinase